MEVGKLAAAAMAERDERPEEPRAPQAPKRQPAQTGTASKRQLKDYPQSLQTAARALWG